jgi:hypothetical protein
LTLTTREDNHEIYHKVISMPERVKSVKALSEALKNLIGLERQAYDIDGPATILLSNSLT